MVRLLSVLRRDLVCRDAVALITAYLDDALSSRDRARFDRHLAACDGCDEYLRQIRVTIAAVGRVEPEDLAPEAREAIVDLLLSYRAEAADEGGDGRGDGAPDL
jgi:anti-sigma factor RsiW